MNKYVVYWWVMWCLQVLGFATAAKFGLYQEIIGVDPTHITKLIGFIHITASLILGWCIWQRREPWSDALWYTAETQLGIGMLGTLIGFIIMLNSAFAHIATGDIESIKGSIAMIGIGMGVAIRATLLGLLSGILIKAQLLVLDKACASSN
jgi:MotA/TolQ/ExbB proton channel family